MTDVTTKHNLEEEILVKVEGLSKKFCIDLKTSLWYGVKDLWSNILGNSNQRHLRPKEFWAVRDINFELRRGECLGLIGHNGAGKSTLLKILNGLIKPDEGKVTIKGRVGALIELGAGFNPILSGRENIYNNGAILGFSKFEIENKLEAIINYSELREFIDMPVQNYSSGMKIRLGFAVAAQMEPDVLIIDEVLAVGDMAFVLKCFKTIDSILPNTAIVFVSHSMPMISRISTNLLVMEKGKSIYNGRAVGKGIDIYYNRVKSDEMSIVFDDGSLKLKDFFINDKNYLDETCHIEWGHDLRLHFEFQLFDKIKFPIFNIIIFDKEQRPIAMIDNNRDCDNLFIRNNIIEFEIIHKNLQLSKGIYTINLAIADKDTNAPKLRYNNLGFFQVIHEDDIWQPFLLSSVFK